MWIFAKLPPGIRAHFPQPVKASELRAAAAWDLLYLSPAAKDAVPSLIAALKDDDVFVRLDAATAFGHIGPEAAPAIPALVQALTNQHRGVRFNSAYSLELLGPLAKDASPALKAAMNDSDPDVRRKALEALHKIDSAGFISSE
ncbi:MAG TPA: HEAT repeat domain-containing protein [Terriglobales bacterium]|nr:HEAT repeat domain-containing protein [Terriglobales bacterium]